MWSLFQFALACLYGGWVFLALADDPNPKVPLFGGLIVGFAGSWATMFVIVWVRYGWKAARSMSMSP